MACIFLGIVVIVLGSVMIWALVQDNEAQNNLSIKNQQAAATAQNAQQTKDQATFAEQAKNPLADFQGPSDLGSVDFKYPKTWSVYVASDGSNGSDYQAYLNPGQVPSVTGQNKYALRVSIVNQSYDQVLQQYAGLVQQGQLRSSNVTTSGFNGNRLDGNFSTTLQGSAVFFKIRDTTLILRTDSPTFQDDFNSAVSSLTFSQ